MRYKMEDRTITNVLNISIQGIEGCFHHDAARGYFGEGFEVKSALTFDAALEKVISGAADYGVIAIENSIAGSIIPNYQLLRKSGLRIGGEISIHIGQHLMALPGARLQDITEVQSHPMALHQCKDFFLDYSEIKLVESPDTAYSAKMIAINQMKGVAAIAGELAADIYGLEIIAHSIESHKDNYTRFLIVSSGNEIVSDPDKASIYFQTAHASGSLGKVLNVISSFGVNLSKIQSHPVPSRNVLYGFYADLEIEGREQFEQVLKALDDYTTVMEVLGVYRKGGHNE